MKIVAKPSLVLQKCLFPFPGMERAEVSVSVAIKQEEGKSSNRHGAPATRYSVNYSFECMHMDNFYSQYHEETYFYSSHSTGK